MTRTFRDRLTLLGTASLFAVALVAAPVQFSSVTPDLASAHAAGGPDAGGGGGRVGDGGAGGSDSHGSGGGSTDSDSSGGRSGR